MSEALFDLSGYNLVFVVLGIICIAIEATIPGFFIAVPGTALIVLGILGACGVDCVNSPLGLIGVIFAAIVAAIVSVLIYKKLSSGQDPITTGKSNLVGKTGFVTVVITPNTLTGKVEVDNVVWSAKSTGNTIIPGKSVKVVQMEGVHLVVSEVD